jgi:hypothetical protein
MGGSPPQSPRKLTMASKSEIIDQIEALAVHCRPPIMSIEQRDLWMRDWCADLADFPLDAIQTACRKWRHSGSTKFPTAGQLVPIVRDSLPVEKTGPVRVWSEATQAEYESMSLRDKIREHTILAHEARLKAGPMFRNSAGATPDKPKGQHLAAEEMPDVWHRWTAEAERHEAEAARLRKFLHGKQPLAAE